MAEPGDADPCADRDCLNATTNRINNPDNFVSGNERKLRVW